MQVVVNMMVIPLVGSKSVVGVPPTFSGTTHTPQKQFLPVEDLFCPWSDQVGVWGVKAKTARTLETANG
jgi:hypothetical protein